MMRLLVVCAWKMTNVLGWREKKVQQIKINRWATVGKGLIRLIFPFISKANSILFHSLSVILYFLGG
jgi:hypothetical protein